MNSYGLTQLSIMCVVSMPSKYLEVSTSNKPYDIDTDTTTRMWNNYTNMTADNQSSQISIERLLIESRGPRRRLGLLNAATMTAVYAAIFITGVIGNVSTCLVIAKCRYLRSATNYYLFNLAVADLFVLLLGLPQETYSFWSAYPWPFSETFCVVRTLAAESSTYASILTITAFTVERYVGICHPMRRRACFQTSLPSWSTVASTAIGGRRPTRAVKAIVGIWLTSVLLSGPIVVQYGVNYISDPSTGLPIADSAVCDIRQDRYARRAFEVATLLFFCVPMTMIGVLYGLIWVAIRRRSHELSRRGSYDCGGPGVLETSTSVIGGLPVRTLPVSGREDGGCVAAGMTSRRACRPTGPAASATAMMRARRKQLGSGLQSAASGSATVVGVEEPSRTRHLVAARQAVLKMLVAVVVVFFICWAPFHAQRLLVIYLSSEQISHPFVQDLLSCLYYISGILYYVSSVVNPIIYNVMSLKFRQSFRDTILRCRACEACCPSTWLSADCRRGNETPIKLRSRRFPASCIGRRLSNPECAGTPTKGGSGRQRSSEDGRVGLDGSGIRLRTYRFKSKVRSGRSAFVVSTRAVDDIHCRQLPIEESRIGARPTVSMPTSISGSGGGGQSASGYEASVGLDPPSTSSSRCRGRCGRSCRLHNTRWPSCSDMALRQRTDSAFNAPKSTTTTSRHSSFRHRDQFQHPAPSDVQPHSIPDSRIPPIELISSTTGDLRCLDRTGNASELSMNTPLNESSSILTTAYVTGFRCNNQGTQSPQ